MKMVPLGRTGIPVSALCLGTMTWGTQNTEAEGHAQADMAVDRGVTFWDTAEMYPVNPVSAHTVGRTEEIIGTWLGARGGRDRLVLATKVAGAGHPEIRGGEALSGPVMRAAVDRSLRRMKTDYIDIYQLHWSNRGAYHFRDIWTYDPRGPVRAEVEAHMLEMLQEAADLIAAGKIRAIALSNETVWGAAKWLSLAERHGLPRMVSVQNEYSLMCRQFDSDWAELSVLEEMPLLAFSPLATGLLSGKYAGDAVPAGSRRTFNPTLSGRMTPQAHRAVAAYLAVAARFGLDPCQMAIAFCMGRPFPVVPIIGASTMAQLATAIGAAEVALPPEVLAAIDAAHRDHPQPY
jgi:aryl-alcohol dehydrogenase-like predicted oxidoreductase